MLLRGDTRARPRSHASIYVYLAAVQPFIDRWAADRGHSGEVTADDIKAVLDPLRGHQLRTAAVAVRSLFRFARKRGLVFTNPAMRLKAGDPGGSLLPMTDAEIQAVEQAAISSAQRLIVALAAVHAARWAAIRDLTLDDLDLPGRRITIAGHRQRLGELIYRALRAWLGHRRTTWPRTPNRHVPTDPDPGRARRKFTIYAVLSLTHGHPVRWVDIRLLPVLTTRIKRFNVLAI